MKNSIIRACFVCGLAWSSIAAGQPPQHAFRPKVQTSQAGIRQSTANQVQPVATQVAAVAPDLLEIYQATKSASTEAAVSAIAANCKKIVTTAARSKADREYAKSLLAWALNRRGELRSDRAASLVQNANLAEADPLDRLAAEDFEAAIQYAPDNWRTHHNFAISLAMKGDYQRAIDELSLAIDLQPDYPNSYFNRGELHFQTENFASAIADYSMAIELNSNDAQYYNSRAHSRLMLESHSEALDDYRQAVVLGPDNAAYQTDLADAYQYLGKWKEAARAYQAAVGADNQYARAYQNAAWLMATCPENDLRNAELALAAANKAIDLSGRDARTLDTLAAALAASGKLSEAQKIQSEAIQLTSDSSEKQDMTQRLRIYQRGVAYRQPKPLNSASELGEPVSTGIRTASGNTSDSR